MANDSSRKSRTVCFPSVAQEKKRSGSASSSRLSMRQLPCHKQGTNSEEWMHYFCVFNKLDLMLPCICSVIDHRRRQNVVRTSVTHSAIASCATFLFLPHFDVFCDLLLNRPTATWNLFVLYNTELNFIRIKADGDVNRASVL